MALEFQVLSRNDRDPISEFSEARFAQAVTDETERRLRLWSVRWRTEALDHYLPLGWSFVARDQGKVRGYFLGQALLFFGGLTQTLWIEHLECADESTGRALVEVAVRLAREKHLQRVLFSEVDPAALSGLIADWKAVPISERIFEVSTTKRSLP